jgi:hypothetical protein
VAVLDGKSLLTFSYLPENIFFVGNSKVEIFVLLGF